MSQQKASFLILHCDRCGDPFEAVASSFIEVTPELMRAHWPTVEAVVSTFHLNPTTAARIINDVTNPAITTGAAICPDCMPYIEPEDATA